VNWEKNQLDKSNPRLFIERSRWKIGKEVETQSGQFESSKGVPRLEMDDRMARSFERLKLVRMA